MTLPLALDTNVLVRLLVNEDPSQAEKAAALIDSSSAWCLQAETQCCDFGI